MATLQRDGAVRVHYDGTSTKQAEMRGHSRQGVPVGAE